MKRRSLVVAVAISISLLRVAVSNSQVTNALMDGTWYIGEVKNGKPEGRGQQIWSDGRMYVGEFKNGKLDGRGTYAYPNGVKYLGEFKDGKIESGRIGRRNGGGVRLE